MTSWLEHPKYVPARDQLIAYLRTSKYRFRRLPPTLFLCGGALSPNRDTLRDYLRKYVEDLDVFYAERVWEEIASQSGLSALEMEAHLANLADLVIVIVESPGTFAELGAFSLSDPLRKKLLPVIDEQYRNHQSFITTGPVRWIDSESTFAPTIYLQLNRILENVDQVENRIARIRRSHTTKISDLSESPKHLLFFLCDLLSVIHPATVEMIEYYLGKISPSILSGRAVNVRMLAGLAVAMGLLERDDVQTPNSRESFLFPSKSYELDRPFHHLRLQDMQSLRAAHVSVLLAIPEAASVMSQIGRKR